MGVEVLPVLEASEAKTEAIQVSPGKLEETSVASAKYQRSKLEVAFAEVVVELGPGQLWVVVAVV